MGYLFIIKIILFFHTVIFVHCSQHGLSPGNLVLKIASFSARGVQLFFVASAFTLFLSYKNRKDKEEFPIRNFYLRRFFRIAPLYYLGIVYYLWQNGTGQNYALGDFGYISRANVISSGFFYNSLQPYWINSIVPGGWSISVEFIFYALLPLIFNYATNINKAFKFFLLSILLNCFLNLFFISHPLIAYSRLWTDFLFFYFPNQLPVFALGIIMYYLIMENKKVQPSLLFASGSLFLAGLATEFNIFPGHILAAVAFVLVGYSLSVYKTKIIINPLLQNIGKLSFSMYLIHFAVLYWLQYFGHEDFVYNGKIDFVLRYGIVTILTAALSVVTYNLIEVPMQTVGRSFIKRIDRKKAIKEESYGM
jgi:peptidoglycan/LPS O-acetylase OafA/YrhL